MVMPFLLAIFSVLKMVSTCLRYVRGASVIICIEVKVLFVYHKKTGILSSRA